MRRLIVGLALLPGLAAAQPAPRDLYDLPNERAPPPWDERKIELPHFPKAESLIKIQVDGDVSFDFFVDTDSVSVGGDGVVRYTLVARSSGGASNVSYEGIRCKDGERRLYALGRSDNTWSEARNSRWVAISDLPVNRVQAVLYATYFCPMRILPRDTGEARKMLERGGDPRASGAADMWNQPR